MPGFTIDTSSGKDGDDGEPFIELYYSPSKPRSMIQKVAVESISGYRITLYNVLEEEERVQLRNVRTTPTTIAFDGDYEIKRWETAIHADDIVKTLNRW